MKTLTTLLLSLICTSTWALNLYSATLPATTQTQSTLKKMAPTALAQVFIKLSGNPDINSLPALSSHLKEAPKLISHYTFQTEPYPTLTLAFNEEAVKDILTNAQQPLWLRPRPRIFTWITLHTPNATDQALSSDPNNIRTHRTLQKAHNIGLNLLIPIMDLQDIQAASALKTAPRDPHAWAAFARYRPEATLWGKITQTSHDWEGTFQLQYKQPASRWTLHAKTYEALIHQLLSQCLQLLATESNSVFESTSRDTVKIIIKPIASLDDYARVLKQLRALGPVQTVDMLGMENNQITLSVKLSGGSEALIDAVAQSADFSVAQTINTGTLTLNPHLQASV